MAKAVNILFLSCVMILLLILPGNFSQWNYQQSWLPAMSKTAQLTAEERNWLDRHQPIRVAFDSSFPPYSYIDESGKLAGTAYDTILLISQKLNMQIKIDHRSLWKDIYQAAIDQKIDVVATMVNRPERQYHFAFTHPYIFKSLVIYTHKSNKQIKSAADLATKKIAVLRNYQYSQSILDALQNITPFYVDSVEDALFAVEAQQADATISFFATSSFLKNKHLLHNIKFVALYKLNSANESIAVRKDWPILANILQKGLNAITQEEKQVINQLWHAPIELPVSFDITGTTESIFVPIILFLLIWLAHINRQNRRLKIVQQELISINNKLKELNQHLDSQVLQDAEQLQSNEQKYRCLVENLHEEYFFYTHDMDGIFSYVSPSITTVLGYSIEQFSKHYSTYQTDHPDNTKIDEYTQRCLKGEKVSAYQIEVLDIQGEKHTLKIQENPTFDNNGLCTGLSGIAHDITQLIQTREQITLLSYYDELTGLANHRLFSDRVEQMITLSHRQHQSLALLFIDLDGFKLINESYGHATGDTALKETANRLEALLRDSDTAARIGSDEFALILLDSGTHSAKVVAKKILNSLLSPFVVNDQQFSIGSSIGIAIYPQDGSDSETLLQQADKAMYYAKNNNKAYAFCTPELDEEGKRRLELEQALRKVLTENEAVDLHELTLVYQSKHYVNDNSIQGYDVLIRWQHPELGVISPSEFIPLAEQTGLIVDLSRWVITQAALQARQWAKDGVKFEKLAIKISAIELINFELAKNVISQIDATGALREWFEIEMTESAVMKMPDVSSKFIADLVNAGVLVVIDGFGMGQSSVSYLKTLPASYFKIDPSFMHNILANPEDQNVVQALITMAHALDKKVIATGIETPEQLHFLHEFGCDIAQGYCFSKPSLPEQVTLYISQIFN